MASKTQAKNPIEETNKIIFLYSISLKNISPNRIKFEASAIWTKTNAFHFFNLILKYNKD